MITSALNDIKTELVDVKKFQHEQTATMQRESIKSLEEQLSGISVGDSGGPLQKFQDMYVNMEAALKMWQSRQTKVDSDLEEVGGRLERLESSILVGIPRGVCFS